MAGGRGRGRSRRPGLSSLNILPEGEKRERRPRREHDFEFDEEELAQELGEAHDSSFLDESPTKRQYSRKSIVNSAENGAASRVASRGTLKRNHSSDISLDVASSLLPPSFSYPPPFLVIGAPPHSRLRTHDKKCLKQRMLEQWDPSYKLRKFRQAQERAVERAKKRRAEEMEYANFLEARKVGGADKQNFDNKELQSRNAALGNTRTSVNQKLSKPSFPCVMDSYIDRGISISAARIPHPVNKLQLSSQSTEGDIAARQRDSSLDYMRNPNDEGTFYQHRNPARDIIVNDESGGRLQHNTTDQPCLNASPVKFLRSVDPMVSGESGGKDSQEELQRMSSDKNECSADGNKQSDIEQDVDSPHLNGHECNRFSLADTAAHMRNGEAKRRKISARLPPRALERRYPKLLHFEGNTPVPTPFAALQRGESSTGSSSTGCRSTGENSSAKVGTWGSFRRAKTSGRRTMTSLAPNNAAGDDAADDDAVVDDAAGDDAVGDDAVGDDAVGDDAVGDDAAGDDAADDNAVGDDAAGDDAAGDDAAGDDAAGDDATGDDAAGDDATGHEAAGDGAAGGDAAGGDATGDDAAGNSAPGDNATSHPAQALQDDASGQRLEMLKKYHEAKSYEVRRIQSAAANKYDVRMNLRGKTKLQEWLSSADTFRLRAVRFFTSTLDINPDICSEDGLSRRQALLEMSNEKLRLIEAFTIRFSSRDGCCSWAHIFDLHDLIYGSGCEKTEGLTQTPT